MYPRIRELRTEHGLTQQMVADYLGVQREVYRRYEVGERKIKVEILIGLANLYDVPCDYIVGITNERIHMQSVRVGGKVSL